ncbi:MAG: YbaB/EbfC family nucleoid-associated protein, partial [Syntrophobacteria bacterium]
MKQARVLQEKMAKMQEELGDKIVESSVGGGMVVA